VHAACPAHFIITHSVLHNFIRFLCYAVTVPLSWGQTRSSDSVLRFPLTILRLPLTLLRLPWLCSQTSSDSFVTSLTLFSDFLLTLLSLPWYCSQTSSDNSPTSLTLFSDLTLNLLWFPCLSSQITSDLLPLPLFSDLHWPFCDFHLLCSQTSSVQIKTAYNNFLLKSLKSYWIMWKQFYFGTWRRMEWYLCTGFWVTTRRHIPELLCSQSHHAVIWFSEGCNSNTRSLIPTNQDAPFLQVWHLSHRKPKIVKLVSTASWLHLCTRLLWYRCCLHSRAVRKIHLHYFKKPRLEITGSFLYFKNPGGNYTWCV
jgi:hypothetical protein